MHADLPRPPAAGLTQGQGSPDAGCRSRLYHSCALTFAAIPGPQVMTQHKFHRVPVVADDGSTIAGIVTRTDIFWALTQTDQEAEDGASYFAEHGLDM